MDVYAALALSGDGTVQYSTVQPAMSKAYILICPGSVHAPGPTYVDRRDEASQWIRVGGSAVFCAVVRYVSV